MVNYLSSVSMVTHIWTTSEVSLLRSLLLFLLWLWQIYVSTSYDASSHFETTCRDVLDIFCRATGSEFDFSKVKHVLEEADWTWAGQPAVTERQVNMIGWWFHLLCVLCVVSVLTQCVCVRVCVWLIVQSVTLTTLPVRCCICMLYYIQMFKEARVNNCNDHHGENTQKQPTK